MNRPRIIALAATLLFALGVCLWMSLADITFDPRTLPQPPRPMAGLIVEEPEEFVEVLEPQPVSVPDTESQPASNPVVENNAADPAPSAGDATVDKGPAGDPPPVQTTRRESPVKTAPQPKPEKTGPADDAKARQLREQEEASRKAHSSVASALSKAEGQNNTKARGKDKGNSGTPDGSPSSKTDGRGRGRGQMNGGWLSPAYNDVTVPNITGTVIITFTINPDGSISEPEAVGGKAPAGTDGAAIQKCLDEVKRHRRLTRKGDAPADRPYKGTVTYTFQ